MLKSKRILYFLSIRLLDSFNDKYQKIAIIIILFLLKILLSLSSACQH